MAAQDEGVHGRLLRDLHEAEGRGELPGKMLRSCGYTVFVLPYNKNHLGGKHM
jgi:hypothetical protein